MKKILILVLSILCLTGQSIQGQEPIDTTPLYMYSSNYILIDQDSGEILASKNPTERVHPASITKVMTLITALELLKDTPLSTTFTVPKEVFEGLTSIASIADFNIGDTLPLSDYLYGIILPSGADATRIISMYLTQTPEGLAKDMNILAEKIGMKNTNFENTSGLDEDNHYSTVEDLSLMVQYALKNDTFKHYYTTVEHTTSPTSKHPEGIKFINTFLKGALDLDFPELYGAKSGYTELAERSLSSVATDGTMNLIFVSTNAPRENKQNTNLLDAINIYKLAFKNYQKITLQKTGDIIGLLDIKLLAKPYEVIAPRDITQFFPMNLNFENLKLEFEPANALVAPIVEGSMLGTVHYTLEDEVLLSEDIHAVNTINKSLRYRILNIVKIIIIGFISLIGLALIAILSIRKYRLHQIRKRKREMGYVRRTRQYNRVGNNQLI